MLEVTLNGERVKLYQLDDMPYFFMRDKPGEPIPLGPPEGSLGPACAHESQHQHGVHG